MMSIKMAKPMGKILLLGFPHEPVLVDLEDLLMKNKSMHAVREKDGPTCQGRCPSWDPQSEPEALRDHVFPLKDVTTAFKTFVERIGGAVKVIVKPNE